MKRGTREAVKDADYLMKLGFGDDHLETVPCNMSNFEDLKREKSDLDSIRFIYPDENVDEVRELLRD